MCLHSRVSDVSSKGDSYTHSLHVCVADGGDDDLPPPPPPSAPSEPPAPVSDAPKVRSPSISLVLSPYLLLVLSLNLLSIWVEKLFLLSLTSSLKFHASFSPATASSLPYRFPFVSDG